MKIRASLLTFPTLWLLAALGLDQLGAQRDPVGSWDAIVVAGCRVDPNGLASETLQRRVERAVEFYHEDTAPVLVFTGGLGAYPPTEAEAAAAHARQLGVPETAIRLEQRSTSTEENARLAARHHPASRVLVITDTYHAFRSERVFERYFDEVDVATSRPLAWPRIRGSLREVLAVAWYAVRGRL